MSQESSLDLSRLLRQQLQSWQAAGLSTLTVPVDLSAPAAAPSAAAVTATAPEPAVQRAAPRTAATPDLTPVSAPSDMPPRKSSSNVPPSGPPLALQEPPAKAAPRALKDRVASLQILAEAVRGCRRCAELAGTRTQTVFGVGNPQAKILFIGEAPGADEDQQGEPFVGKAGQLLNKIIEACRLKREELYICNILKCRPPGNRTPAPDECGNCREYLDGQLAAIDPDYIVCWGTVAAQNLLRTDLTIGKLRGRFYQHGRAKVLCTYHPSYLLRNPPAKKDVWDDMKLFFADMGVKLT